MCPFVLSDQVQYQHDTYVLIPSAFDMCHTHTQPYYWGVGCRKLNKTYVLTLLAHPQSIAAPGVRFQSHRAAFCSRDRGEKYMVIEEKGCYWQAKRLYKSRHPPLLLPLDAVLEERLSARRAPISKTEAIAKPSVCQSERACLRSLSL